MRTAGRAWAGWAAVLLASAGCKSPLVSVYPVSSPAVPLPTELPVVVPGSLEPDYAQLPTADPLTGLPQRPAGAAFRGLSEDVVRRQAAAHAALADAFLSENDVSPPAREHRRPHARKKADADAAREAADELMREVRWLSAVDVRNRAAGDALDGFFRLADAEGRADLLRTAVGVLDRLRAEVRAARGRGLAVPLDPDDLDRQRAALVGTLSTAELGARLLNLDLKRRVGLPGRDADRLWPAGPFPVSADPVDGDAAVQTALERRADLRLLRTLYLRLDPSTLPAVREVLRAQAGLTPNPDAVADAPTLARLVSDALTRRQQEQADAAVRAELAVRRRQLFELIAVRERQTADEVRAAAATLTAQTEQVAVARWKADRAAARLPEAARQGPLAGLAAELESYRARADVLAAVMAWHQTRARLQTAQGLHVE